MSEAGLARTPYDGSATPFTIGLKPLDLAGWLEIDALRAPYLAEKRRLFAERPGDVFAQEAGTDDAQREVLDLIRDYLETRAPDLSRPEARAGEPALKAASLAVQEDLVLMRRGPEGWRLAAASLCFPSSWSLAEKFARPLRDIHIPVPGFGPGTRNEALIERIFDNLAVERPVERANWSLQNNPALYHPLSALERGIRAGAEPTRFDPAAPAASAFIRVERQTLRRLPRSGDILFTIRIHLDPMGKLRAHPDGARLASAFAAQLEALGDSEIAYKGLAADRDLLVAALREMAAL
ncbi:MAG: DUF3445 domain-containing protein [Aquamicrobium sp.]|uniref:heme-dependent oxidative N-demethylase family protein n=1 Tax=Aquamicrobium sp. TaxID=1872579 RepID=UPI00349EB615|nr:DUF3445 domain-containing protein [Aquamicrobium sp.]